jgi:hypothetical protein
LGYCRGEKLLKGQVKDRAVKNSALLSNWEQGVFTQIFILNFFETMEKTNIYDNRGKKNHSEKNFTNEFDTRIL